MTKTLFIKFILPGVDFTNQLVKTVIVILIVLFLVWNIGFSCLVYFVAGCPPAYAVLEVRKIQDNTAGDFPTDIASHPSITKALIQKKRILLPIGTLADLIPGRFFGSAYADPRVYYWDRDYLVNNYMKSTTFWYNSSSYHLAALLC
jgi:hypothetical protein